MIKKCNAVPGITLASGNHWSSTENSAVNIKGYHANSASYQTLTKESNPIYYLYFRAIRKQVM
jgi:hypothetical protein